MHAYRVYYCDADCDAEQPSQTHRPDSITHPVILVEGCVKLEAFRQVRV